MAFLLAVSLSCFLLYGYGKKKDEKQDEIAYVGDHITILTEDLDLYIRRAKLLTVEEDPAAAALQNLAAREIFCYRAEEAGIPNEDVEFEAWLKEYRENIENTTNYGDFEDYIKGSGMTMKEYLSWAASSESFRKEYYSNLFTQKLREDYKAQSVTAPPGSEEYGKPWQIWFQEYKDKAVGAEHLRKVSPMY